MALQKRIVHRAHFGMLGQEFGDAQSALVVSFDADREGLDSAQQEERSVRVHDSAKRSAGGLDGVDQVAAAGGDSADEVGVSGKILGSGVQDDINSKFCRT